MPSRSSGSEIVCLGTHVAHGLEQVGLGIHGRVHARFDDPGSPARQATCAWAPWETSLRIVDRAASSPPNAARICISAPSYSNSPTDMPLHSSCARRTIRSNTGCASPGEADIAFSTSIVAACCSIFSPYSLWRLCEGAISLGAGDRDHRLLGKGAQLLDLGLREAAWLPASEGDRADRSGVAQQWHTDHRAQRYCLGDVARAELRVGVDIGKLHHVAGEDRCARTGWPRSPAVGNSPHTRWPAGRRSRHRPVAAWSRHRAAPRRRSPPRRCHARDQRSARTPASSPQARPTWP